MVSVWRALTGFVSLHDNAAHGRTALVRTGLLLGAGGRWVNHASGDMRTTPLHAAAYNGHLPVVKLLLEEWGADSTLLTTDGWSALHCAASNGYLPVVRYIIEEAKVRPTQESKDGWTALHCASAHGFLPVVRYLVESQGMDLDFPTYAGWTPLHWAACNGYLSVVKYLIVQGADRTATTRSCGSNVLHIAARQGQTSVVTFLLGEEPAGMKRPAHNKQTTEGAPTADASAADPIPSASSSGIPLAAAPSPTLHAATAGVSTAAESVISVAVEDGDAAGAAATSSASAASAAASLPSLPPPARPYLLSDSVLHAPNDAGASPFLLACLRGKYSVVEALVQQRITRTGLTAREIQRAHDAHQGAARKKGGFINHALITFLREWMQEREYAEDAEERSVETLSLRDVTLRSSVADGDEKEDAHSSDEETSSSSDEAESEADEPVVDAHVPYEIAVSAKLAALDNAHLARAHPSHEQSPEPAQMQLTQRADIPTATPAPPTAAAAAAAADEAVVADTADVVSDADGEAAVIAASNATDAAIAASIDETSTAANLAAAAAAAAAPAPSRVRLPPLQQRSAHTHE